jgi:hypothetical protein
MSFSMLHCSRKMARKNRRMRSAWNAFVELG